MLKCISSFTVSEIIFSPLVFIGACKYGLIHLIISLYTEIKYVNPSYYYYTEIPLRPFNTLGEENPGKSEAPAAFSVSFSRLVQPSRVTRCRPQGSRLVAVGCGMVAACCMQQSAMDISTKIGRANQKCGSFHFSLPPT